LQKIAPLIGADFFIEEISDGFLMFYKRKGDFLAVQIDRMNFDDVLSWLRAKQIDEYHIAVADLLRYLKSISPTNAKMT